MAKSFTRADRIADAIKEEIAVSLLTDVDDPRVQGITITGVKVSADMSIARVFFTAGPERDRAVMLNGLNKAKGFIKNKIFKKIVMRACPDIEFVYDEAFERGMRMENIIRKIGKKDDED